MTIKEIVNKFVKGEFTYGEALSKLNELKQYLDEDDFDRVTTVLRTLREIYEVEKGNDRDPIDHCEIPPCNFVPNEMYSMVFDDTVKMIESGVFPQNIGRTLFSKFRINDELINYFYNEALEIVRLQTLTPESIIEIGEEYVKMKNAQKNIFSWLPYPPLPTKLISNNEEEDDDNDVE
jgi:hypothetical protein